MDDNYNIELDKSSKKPIIIVGLLFGLIVFFIFFYLSYNSNDLTEEQLLKINKHTKVIDIYVNKNEHNFIYVKYSNGITEGLDDPYQIGDSISKNRGDSIEYIFRGNHIIQNNLFEVARKESMMK
ncbi:MULTISPECIES: hypothetical protein [unclassified Kaistella]|uniref:hypothetical protein n=1 Tax=unclassified Kaistella TaxID=2762626 RepID=UPI0027364CF4|nr:MULTISPECIES: hypothetical protein [unclassified Kaistella]MDP2453905.1 hypothetical protein [Kaistella sp. SH11-4b]MDP2456962.1 hypothetical protein [Kaistella sp. SH40-3]MDP2459719.1 hypothetical protein [Kaistella sp. SH19-2b]